MAIAEGEIRSLGARSGIAATVPFALYAGGRDEDAPPVPARFALAAGEKAAPARGYPRRVVYIAIGVSLLLHLTLFGYSLLQSGGALSLPEVKDTGAEQGRPENLNVSVISEADLRNLSTIPMPQQPVVQPPEPQETPPEPERKEASLPPQKTPFQAQDDPQSFAARFADQFTASMKQAFAAAERQRPSRPTVQAAPAIQAAPNVRFMRPAATHSGASDAFAEQVAWALAATVPQGNGVWGSTIVTFVVSANGQVQDLRLIKSSGDKFLDTGALMAVKQAHMPTPAAELASGDRRFNVEYVSR